MAQSSSSFVIKRVTNVFCMVFVFDLDNQSEKLILLLLYPYILFFLTWNTVCDYLTLYHI